MKILILELKRCGNILFLEKKKKQKYEYSLRKILSTLIQFVIRIIIIIKIFRYIPLFPNRMFPNLMTIDNLFYQKYLYAYDINEIEIE